MSLSDNEAERSTTGEEEIWKLRVMTEILQALRSFLHLMWWKHLRIVSTEAESTRAAFVEWLDS